jgi:cobalt-zinc-cadmium efflux system outer membrane protein
MRFVGRIKRAAHRRTQIEEGRAVKIRSSILVLTLFTAGALPTATRAQESQTAHPTSAPQAGQPLTVASALDIAERQNLDLLAARAQRAVALAGVRVAGERPNPTASFAALRDTPHESLFFDQQIETGGKRKDRIEVARQEGALTDADLAAVERQVRHSVRDAYFGLAHARAMTSQQNDVLKLALRLHDIAQARFQAGDVPELEVTQADLEVERAQTDVQVAQQEERVALSDLNALLDDPAATDWNLGDALATLPPALALDDLLSRSGASNAEVARIVQESKVEQSHLVLLKAERIPNLGIEFGVDFNSPGQDGFREGPRGQITVELPLFSRNQGEIAQSQAAQAALNGQLTAARRAVDAQVESAYFDLEARRTQAQLYRERLLPASSHLEELAEESYRAGRANILTVLGAQQDVEQVQREYIDSLMAVHSAFAQLEESVGAALD